MPTNRVENVPGPNGANDLSAVAKAEVHRLEELPHVLPRLSVDGGLPAEITQAPTCCYSLIGPPGICGQRCADRIASFSAYFRKTGGQDRRYAVADRTVLVDGEPYPVTAITMPLATLPIVGSGDTRIGAIPRSARKAARKARRLGYYYKAVDPERHLDDIFAIRSSAKERQGRPMPGYYFERLSRILDLEGYCPRHTSAFYGIFNQERLVAYCTVVFLGEMAQLDNILGHKAHLHDGVMDLLVEEASREIAVTRPWVRGLNYLYATGWAGLAEFKANTGFLPQYTCVTMGPPGIACRIEEVLSRGALGQKALVGAAKHDERPELAKVQPLPRIPRVFGGERRQPQDWSEPSGIHSVLRELALPTDSRILCVGAGGNLDYSALSAVVDRGYLPLLAEWRSPDIVSNVEKTLADRCIVLPREWKEIKFGASFDVVIFDLYYKSFMTILMREFRSASKLVSLGGFLIVKFCYDIDSGLGAEDRQALGEQYIRRFKSAQPTLADISDAFRGSAFHVHGLVDRANERATDKNLGWLILRKVRPT